VKTQKDVVIGEIEKRPGSFRIRFFWYVGLFTFALAALAILAAWQTFVILAQVLVYAITAICAIAILIGSLYFGWLAIHTIRHKVRRDEATTAKLENESRIITHDHNHVAYRWNDGELFPVYVPQLGAANALALPMGEGVQSLDFIEVMTKAKRCFSIVADQQTGKTTLAHYIVEYWMQRGIKPLVISQKYDAGEYANCEKFGPDSASITAGFDLVRQEAAYRQQLADGGKPYNAMRLQPIFLEDFTSFASILDNKALESFVAQALTVFAARGLLLYFIVHSRNKNAFGLGKQGAALKDQMTRLEIIPAYTTTGEVDHASKQIVCSIGSNLEAVPVTGIPAYTPRLDYECRLSLYSLSAGARPQIEPDKTEATVLRRYDKGDGISAIALAVFGQQNGFNNDKVKNILAKFGREVKDQRVREDMQL